MVLFIGLAASLQQRVLAQMKIKEEHDERQKQAELNSIHNGNISIASIKTEGNYMNTGESIKFLIENTNRFWFNQQFPAV